MYQLLRKENKTWEPGILPFGWKYQPMFHRGWTFKEQTDIWWLTLKYVSSAPLSPYWKGNYLMVIGHKTIAIYRSTTFGVVHQSARVHTNAHCCFCKDSCQGKTYIHACLLFLFAQQPGTWGQRLNSRYRLPSSHSEDPSSSWWGKDCFNLKKQSIR